MDFLIHLYTHNDLDGIGCGILAKMSFNEEVEVHYNSVARINMQIERFFDMVKQNNSSEDLLFITDLTVNEANCKKIEQFVQDRGKAQFIDHHKTALHLNKYNWAKVTVEYEDGRFTSATSLFYDYLKEQNLITPKPSVDEFVELIRQYDTWEWEKNNLIKAKQLNDLFSLVSLDEFETKMIERLKSDESSFSYNEFEQQLLKMEEDKINRYIRKKNRELVQTFIGEHCVGIVHAEMYHSELGNELGKENSHLDYIVILNMGGKKVSFRTIHDHVDVSAVAGKFGGGGHVKASGCSMNEDAYKLFVHEVFPLEPSKIDAPKNQYNVKNNPEGSLYENVNREKWLIKQYNNQWIVEHDQKMLPLTFNNFIEAEHFIKRQYTAALSRDDQYMEYMKNRKRK